MAISFPKKPADLTPEWVTSQLRASGLCQAASVNGLAIETVADKGQCSDVCALRLSYDATVERSPSMLIAKFATSDPILRARQSQDEGFLREVDFYRDMAHQVGARVPRCYAAECDRSTKDYVLLLELIPRSSSARTGLSKTGAATVIRSIAETHAKWWNHPGLDHMPWLVNHRRPEQTGATMAFTPAIVDAIAPHAEYLPEEARRTLLDWSALGSRLTHEHTAGNAPACHTLTHGDLHRGQIMWEGDDQSPVIIDWQNAGTRSAVVDVARLLSTSLTPEDRRASERELVELHYELLCSQGITGYSLETHWRCYRYSLLWSLWFNLWAVGFTDTTVMSRRLQRHAVDWRTAVIGWPAQALIDNGVADDVRRWSRALNSSHDEKRRGDGRFACRRRP